MSGEKCEIKLCIALEQKVKNHIKGISKWLIETYCDLQELTSYQTRSSGAGQTEYYIKV